MSKWDEMSEAERKAYVNQDVVHRTWREPLCADIGQGLFDELAHTKCLGGVASGDTEWDDTIFSELVDPVELECLRLFYGEKKTRAEIALAVEVQYTVEGRVVKSRPLTVDVVKRKLESGRKAIKEALSKQTVSHLLVRKSKLTN